MSSSRTPSNADPASSSTGITSLRRQLQPATLQERGVTNDFVKFPQSTPHTMIYGVRCRRFVFYDNEVNRVIASIWAYHLRQILPRILDVQRRWLDECPLALDAIAVLFASCGNTRGCRATIVECFNFCQDNAPAISRAFNKHGIKASIFQLFSCQWNMRGILFDETGHIIEDGDTSQPDEVIFGTNSIINFTRSRGDTINNIDDMRIFTLLTECWLISCSGSASIGDRVTIIEEMTRFSDTARGQGVLNCGAVEELHWFSFVSYTPDQLFAFFMGAALEPFRRLLNSLQSSHELGLLTGKITDNLPFLQRVALTVPQDAREDKDRFADWIKTVPRGSGVGHIEILAEEMEVFGGVEVEHVFPPATTATGDLPESQELIPDVVGVYELEAQ